MEEEEEEVRCDESIKKVLLLLFAVLIK